MKESSLFICHSHSSKTQMSNKIFTIQFLWPYSKCSIVEPLSQKLQTDTAFGTDSLSSIMYCKWIKLMHPSLFCCWTLFISLIFIHNSYSVSQLHLLCCWQSEKFKCRAITAHYLSDEQICETHYFQVCGQSAALSVYICWPCFFSYVIIHDLLLNRPWQKKKVLSSNSRVHCTS